MISSNNHPINDQYESHLKDWREQEKKALELLHLIGSLRFDRSVELVIFRKDIYDSRPSELLNDQLIAQNYIDKPINISDCLMMAKAIAAIPDLVPSRIDLGKLVVEWMEESTTYLDENEFIINKLSAFVGHGNSVLAPKDVILYGFGRIGRIAARRIVAQTGRGEQLRLKAIVIRPQMKDRYEEAEKRAALLRTDSVHGAFRGTVEVIDGGDALLINGNKVMLIYAAGPAEIDYTEFGIENGVVIDNTGVWRDKASLSQHMRPGVSHVLFTAPGKDIPNIVYGINHEAFNYTEENIICAASCTTNAIAPVIKVIDDAFGIEKGHLETIHAYTSDQNLLDNFHKKPRRGRAAAINMVLTSTGAGEAVAKVMPHLAGILTGNAVRVPTPNVSLAIINLSLKSKTDKNQLNELLKNASLHGDLVEQIQFSTSEEYVSSHVVGSVATSVVDGPSTIVSRDGSTITLYVWYDNEFGYTCQVIRLAKHVAKVRRMCYY
ncbi:MAG: glyceraldehyde-3-phosphate dehydrogenase [Saprospiraceae bacterium]|nr:glyceraldehyde-3-phosphate dehydrogenase [Saprospiraceae bacterium]